MRTMVYLPDELHRGLKHLAVERRTSLSKLVKEAVEMFYREDLEDLRIAQKRLRDYLKHPKRAVPYASYRAKRRTR
ncbi:MAG: hypothetical protein A3G87_00065 [Omnitrophica bacterium RIFCSPLOWO2_12_FULL_50_11]|nr:MAG: hypothetical protein A3G87_00065 [Omnitrophica bacterium RIFCSPLOWO2_12_FULL_50_11]